MGDALWHGFLEKLDRGARQVADAFERQVVDAGLRSFEKRVARGRVLRLGPFVDRLEGLARRRPAFARV